MKKFCIKCGYQMDSEVNLCVNCGAVQPSALDVSSKVSGPPPSQQAAIVPPVKHKGKLSDKLVGIAAVVIAAVIVIFIAAKVFGTPAHEKPIKHLITAVNKNNFKEFKKAISPLYLSDSDMEDEIKDYFKMAVKSVKGLTISYKITGKEKISKTELKSMQKDYESYFDKDIKINAGYELEIKTTKKDGNEKEIDYETLNVYKINGKWCIDPRA